MSAPIDENPRSELSEWHTYVPGNTPPQTEPTDAVRGTRLDVPTTTFMQTFTGRKVTFNHLRKKDITIRDIAHALSLQCRFAGHTKFHYSVAQHSLYVMQVAREHKLEALMHDAAEAYLQDLGRAVREYVRGYYELENLFNQFIADKYGLKYENGWPQDVIEADEIVLGYEHGEVMDNIASIPWPTKDPRAEFGVSHLGITPSKPEDVERIFLDTFIMLYGGEGD